MDSDFPNKKGLNTMEHKLNPIILLPIFIILMVVTFRVIKDSLKFDGPASFIISLCVSALAVIGLNANLPGIIEAVLIPYTALSICIPMVVLLAFLFKAPKKDKNKPSAKCQNPQSDIDELRKILNR